MALHQRIVKSAIIANSGDTTPIMMQFAWGVMQWASRLVPPGIVLSSCVVSHSLGHETVGINPGGIVEVRNVEAAVERLLGHRGGERWQRRDVVGDFHRALNELGMWHKPLRQTNPVGLLRR
jgi:hypothetical protein